MGIHARVRLALMQVMSLNMLMWLTMLTSFAGIVLLAAAAYMALAAVLTTALAALFVGIAMMLVGVVLTLLIRWVMSRTPAGATTVQTKTRTGHMHANGIAATIRRYAAICTRRDNDAVLAGVLLAVIALSTSPGLRRLVLHNATRILRRAMTRRD